MRNFDIEIGNITDNKNPLCTFRVDFLQGIYPFYNLIARRYINCDTETQARKWASEYNPNTRVEIIRVEKNATYTITEPPYEGEYTYNQIVNIYNTIIDKNEYANISCWLDDMVRAGLITKN